MAATTMTKKVDLNLIYYNGEFQSLSAQRFSVLFTIYAQVPAGGGDAEELQVDYNKSYARILGLCEGVLPDSLVVSSTEYLDEHWKTLDAFANNLIVLPVMSESVLSAALFLKFNSLCTENVRVKDVTLIDHVMGIDFSHGASKPDYSVLPGMEYIQGDFPLWQEPWWCRADGYTFDTSATNAEELAILRQHVSAEGDALLTDIDKSIDGLYNPEDAIQEQDGEVIKVDFTKKTDKTIH